MNDKHVCTLAHWDDGFASNSFIMNTPYEYQCFDSSDTLEVFKFCPGCGKYLYGMLEIIEEGNKRLKEKRDEEYSQSGGKIWKREED